MKRPLPQRPEVMPQAQTTSSVKGRTRYSDKELAEFKSIILEKLEQAKNDLNYLQEQIGQKGDSDSGISETTFASSDDGSTSMEREYLVQMASRLRKYIDHLDKALVRIENKTYGICRVTGKLIEKERLMAVPHATLSMEGKRLESHAPQHQEGG
ncbi:MAG: TraR/DksA C4-type zinc finger protein [Chitinophagales bacterium]|nr:TraR/DksA C4-type zinc finger protein [Chitinophagales bacterium]MDW8393240.1 TraR/DksA C4-type zinc finger protein [Chitinophagales bacterium]